jgi:hypothetical protein
LARLSNSNKVNGKELIKQINEADVDKVGQYMKIFDRILLYTIAVNSVPKESLDATVKLWETVVKKGIDEDAKLRTNFMESYQGRKSKYQKEPDGEELRLYCLKQYELAKDIIKSNLTKPENSAEEPEEGAF